MKLKKAGSIVVILFFTILSIFFFRTYFLTRQVPLPFNLLTFLYSPWKYESWQGYPNGIPNKPLGFDTLKLFYPYRSFTTEQLKKGKIPLWNPYVFAGNVHAATYQANVFYPLNIVYFLLSQADAWSMLIIIQPVLVGWFMYLFLRSLGQSKTASLLGATGLAFSGWMIAMWQEVLVLVHSFLWLPLALYASNKIWAGTRRSGVVLLAFALAMSVLAGFLQMSIYVFGTVVVWNIYLALRDKEEKKDKRGRIISIVMGFVSGVLLSSVQWVPAVEAYMYSARGTVNAKFLFDSFLSPIWYLVTLLIPDFWGNPGSYNYFSPLTYIQERTIWVGLFILLFAIVILVQKTKSDVRFWKIFTLAVFSLGFALPTSWLWYYLKVPIMSVAQPARIFALSAFGFSVLAGFGYDSLYTNQKAKKILLRTLGVFMAIIAGLFVFVGVVMLLIAKQKEIVLSWPAFAQLFNWKGLYSYPGVSLRNLLLPLVTIVAAWMLVQFFFHKKKLFVVAVFVMTLVTSAYAASKILYFSDRQFEYPVIEPLMTLTKSAGLDRVWSYGEGHMLRNIPSFFRLYSPEGYDALYPRRYGELLYTIQMNGKVTDEINRTDVVLYDAGSNEVMTDNTHRLRLISLLGVKYITESKKNPSLLPIAPEIRFPSSDFSLYFEDDAWRIWEYKKALPRALVLGQVLVRKDRQGIVDVLMDPSVDLKSTVVLEEDVEIGKNDEPFEGVASIADYQAEKIAIQVTSNGSGWVFLSDNYYPGWKAYVDGVETKIYRANYTFRAVQVSGGEHTVTFTYEPISFKIGIVLTIIGGILLFFGLLVRGKE